MSVLPDNDIIKKILMEQCGCENIPQQKTDLPRKESERLLMDNCSKLNT